MADELDKLRKEGKIVQTAADRPITGDAQTMEDALTASTNERVYTGQPGNAIEVKGSSLELDPEVLGALLAGELAHQDLRTRFKQGSKMEFLDDPPDAPDPLTKEQNEANFRASEKEAHLLAAWMLGLMILCPPPQGRTEVEVGKMSDLVNILIRESEKF